jgi:hypothetical protein
MLVIRPEQMEVLKEAALRSFEDEMLEHLAEFSPPLFKAVGEEQMRKAVSFGIGQAKSYGFTFRGPVRLYLELMLLFGTHFDTDPQYPWAAEILTDQDTGSQMDRAERLYEKTMDYREKVAGPQDAYSLEALKQIAIFARQHISLPSHDFIPGMLQYINIIYPQKADYVGDEGLESLIHKGIECAQLMQFSTVRGMTLVIVLMLAFGHGCAADPLYPWIERTLKDEAIIDAEARAKRLEKKALTWLDHVLNYSSKGMQA